MFLVLWSLILASKTPNKQTINLEDIGYTHSKKDNLPKAENITKQKMKMVLFLKYTGSRNQNIYKWLHLVLSFLHTFCFPQALSIFSPVPYTTTWRLTPHSPGKPSPPQHHLLWAVRDLMWVSGLHAPTTCHKPVSRLTLQASLPVCHTIQCFYTVGN